MWKWKHFDSLDGLLDFVNEHELESHQFKIVNSPAPRRSNPYGAPMYLIYQDRREEWIEPELAAVEAVPLEEEQENALDAVEQLLHDRPPDRR
jgi:hypothetical protein